MNYKNTYEGIDSKLVKIVKQTAKGAMGKAGLSRNELPDIEQELMIAVLNGLKCKRKNIKNESAFARGIANRQLKQIFRKQNRKSKRWQRYRISLNISVELDSGDLDELINLVDTENLLRNNSYAVPDPYQDIDLAANIESLIRLLPEKFRELIREKKDSAKLTRREIRQIRKELEKLEALSLFLQ